MGPDVITRTSPNECHRELGIDVSIPCDIVHILEDTPWEESPPAVLGPDVITRTSPNECHRELGIDVSIPCDIVHILEDTLSKVTNVTGNWASTFPFPVTLCTF